MRWALAPMAVVALAGCECGFDAGKLDVLACTTDGECRPDQDCVDDLCTQRRCSDVAECGAPGAFGCVDGFCESTSCDGIPCVEGLACIDGLCVAPPDDGGTDAGTDAAVPCGGPAECDDGLDCTDDACIGGFCANTPLAGTCAIDGACWLPDAVDPTNPCQICDPAFDGSHWKPDDTRTPSDAVDCTADRCQGGVPVHDADDALCAGRICSACAGGCIDPPVLKVDCPDTPGVTGGAPVTCTITAADLQLAGDCVSCTPVVGMTSLVRDDFQGCPRLQDLGWQGTTNGVNCGAPGRLGPDVEHSEDQLVVQSAQAVLERYVDTTDFDAVQLCFDFAHEEFDQPPLLTVELNTGGAWVQVWTSAVLTSVQEAWQNVCLDLDALAPLAAGNPVLGVRFLPDAGGRGQLEGDIYLDNVAIDAWTSRTVTWPGRLFTSDFAACSTDDWVVEGAVDCPLLGNGAVDVAGVMNGTFTLTRELDLGSRCEALRLGLSVFADGADANESVTATLTRDAASVPLWGVSRGPEPSGVFLPFEASVSHVDPGARFAPAVTLAVAAQAAGFSDSMAIDDVWFDGAECEAAPEIVSAAAVVPQGGGGWTVDVSGDMRATAYLQCTWDGRADTIATETVQFCANAECSPGASESRACGTCGTETRRCDSACRWLDWSACNDLPCQCCDPYTGCAACCC